MRREETIIEQECADGAEGIEVSDIKGTLSTLDTLPVCTEAEVAAELSKSRTETRKLPDNITSRQLYGDIIRIAWPSLAEMFLSSLVSMVDMMMVGGRGTSALSAIGLAMQPRFLIMTMVMALNTGATAMIARARGAHDQKRANIILRQSLMFVTALAIFGTVVGTLGSEWMIRFMASGGMSDETLRLGTVYLQIQMLGFPFAAWSFCLTATLRGTGNSKPCMVYNIVANLVNILGNWLLINGNLGFPELGVAGASLATVIGQAVATAMAFGFVLSGKYYLKLSLKKLFKFDKDIISGIVKVGMPAMIEQLIMRVGMVIYSRTVSSLGELSLATHNICTNIQSMSFMVGQGFAVSATSLVGQSLGRLRMDMAEHYSRRCRRLSMSVAIMLGLVFAVFGKYISMLYSTDPEVVNLAAYIMIFVGFLQPFQSSQFVTGGVLRGAGDTKSTAVIMLITVVILRTALAYLFVTLLDMGLFGAWLAMGIDQIVRAILIKIRYNQGKWKRIRL